MKGRITALLIMAVILLPVAGLMYASDEAEASPSDITFTGIIEYNDIVMKKADVHLVWKVEGADPEFLSGYTKTDDFGFFTIVINGEYDLPAANSVTVTCTTMNAVCISGSISINALINGNEVELGTITDFPQGYVPKAEISVLGSVKYEGTTVEGARVTLVDNATDNKVTFKNTDSKGSFELKCEPGIYYITVERGGFFDWRSEPFELGESSSKVLDDDIHLIITPETTYWGLDLPHLFTLIGMLMALILLIAVVVYVLWIRKHPGMIRIIDDSPDEN